MKSSKSILITVLALWLVIATAYLIRTPYDHRQHDIEGHIQYVQTIISEHRFPKSHEAFESHQPPLYYLISSFIAPVSLSKEKMDVLYNGHCPSEIKKHLLSVQFFSILYGAIALWIIGLLLQNVTDDKIAQLLALLFIATTPKFVFVFSTYSNDSLATLLAIAIVFISYKLYLNWSWTLAGVLLAVATVGIYTKYTIVFCMTIISLICLKNLLQKKSWDITQKRIIAIFALSAVLFSPWMVFHIYRHTGLPIVVGCEDKINRNFSPREIANTFRAFVKIPLIQQTTHEWDDPWAHPSPDSPLTKMYDYFAFSFITSIIGEFMFYVPSARFIWVLLFIHLFARISAFKEIFKNNITRLAAAFIFLSYALQIFIVSFMKLIDGSVEDYRYICCSWIGWAVLYASTLSRKSSWSWISRVIFILGIIIQIYFLMLVKGSDI